jgi:hypothetical protein
MVDPFIGSEAIAAGTLTRHALRRDFVALHQDVYVAKGVDMTPQLRATAAWLRSRRRGILAGFSAAALHGARWVDPRRPATVIDTNRRRATGVMVWADAIGDDEVWRIRGMAATSPARTALDIASRYPEGLAVASIDALARATELKIVDVEMLAERYKGRRGIRAARAALELVDPGAESPRETWLRLLLIRAGFPRPQTQISVYEYGRLAACVDMGWEDIKVAAEYEGDHHRSDRVRFNNDIKRLETLTDLGWIVVRVTAEDGPGGIIRRVAAARARRM